MQKIHWLGIVNLFQTFPDVKLHKLEQLRVIFSPACSLLNLVKIAIGNPLDLWLYATFSSYRKKRVGF